MRWAVVLLSSGMGRPSAVEAAREVEEVLPGPEKSGGKESGSEFRLRWDARPRRSFEGGEEMEEALGGA